VKVIDPGHEYLLDSLDGPCENRLVFVKREGEKYPGNVGRHAGTTLQEVLRALLHRARYVNGQQPCRETEFAIRYLKETIYLFEMRAARLHGRPCPGYEDAANGTGKCPHCGHVGCPGCQSNPHLGLEALPPLED